MSDLTPFSVGDFARCKQDRWTRYEILEPLDRYETSDHFVHKVRVYHVDNGVYRIQPIHKYLMPSEMLQILASWQEIYAVTRWKPEVRA